MVDKLRFQATPRNAPGFQVEIRPDPEHCLELKIRTGEYPAGIVGGVQASDQAFRGVLRGQSVTLSGREGSSVKLELIDKIVHIGFTAPKLNPAGTLELTADDYGSLVEHAIASRTGPRTVFA